MPFPRSNHVSGLLNQSCQVTLHCNQAHHSGFLSVLGDVSTQTLVIPTSPAKKKSRVFLFFFSPIKKTRKSLLCFPPFHQSAWLPSEFAIIRLVTIKKLSRQNKQVSRRRLLRKTHDTNECLQDLHTRASKRISQGRHTRTILKQEPPPPPRRSTKACQAPLRVHFLKIFMEGKDPSNRLSPGSLQDRQDLHTRTDLVGISHDRRRIF